MALSLAERSSTVDKILTNVTNLRGVTAAAIIDADGLVTHVRRDFDIDTDALAFDASGTMYLSFRDLVKIHGDLVPVDDGAVVA